MQQDMASIQRELISPLQNMESRILSKILQMHTDLGKRILEASTAIVSLEGNTYLPTHEQQQVTEDSLMSGMDREDNNYGSEDSSVIIPAHNRILKPPSSSARNIK